MNKSFLIFIFFAIAALLSSCALRDDESPTISRNTFVPPTSPDLVMVNLQFSVIEKDVNNYMSCFVDSNYSTRSYSYVPDVISQIQYPIFQNWKLSNEKTYFTSLLSLMNESATSNVFFSNPVLNTLSDTAVYDADYLLRADHQKTNVAKTLKGKIRLILSADSRNLWSIHKWIDFQSMNSDTTWSVLKANFSN
ncbi:MAG TPA: hypothetical protein VN514_03310 [Ignavibacteria bacterium]|nr:hypothetical protein [Ignavibacteria bacterium]